MNRTASVFSTLLLTVFLLPIATAVDIKKSNKDINNGKHSIISYHSHQAADFYAERDQRYLSPDKPVRVLVRLHGQALAPFEKQQRKQFGGSPQKLSDAQRQTYTKAVIGQQQKLRNHQQHLLDQLQQKQLLHSVHARFITATHAVSITTNAGDIDAIKQLPQVASVHIERRYHTTMAASLEQVRATDAWQLLDNQGQTLTGKGIRVGILDTGIDYTHPDLGGCVGDNCKVKGGINFTTPVAWSPDQEEPDFDTVIADDDFMDRDGHGTHVAGTVAANGEIMGVAPDAYLYAVKVLGDDGWGLSSGIIAGIEWAMDPDGDPLTDDQLDIINLSLGGGLDAVMNEAIDAAVEAGIVVVVAAGNMPGYEMLGSPASAEKAITVGAIDKQDKMALFTSRGPLRDGDLIKPELVAPGVSIHSTWVNNSHRAISGTSMAAPHVAGAAAILRQRHPHLSASQIKALLVGQARDLGEDVFTQGAGALDVLASAEASWLLDPAVVFWGRFGPNNTSETISLPLQIKNLGNTPLNFNEGLGGEPIIGTQLALAADDESPLLAGESRDVTLSLAIDQAAIPISDRLSLHHEGVAELTMGGQSQRVANALIKAAILNIAMAPGLEYLLLFSEDTDYQRILAPINCEGEAEQRTVYLKPGRYHSFWQFADEPCTAPDKIVFSDAVELATQLDIETPAKHAPHRLGVGQIVDAGGEVIDPDTLSLENHCLNIWHPALYYLYMDCAPYSREKDYLTFINAMPEGYQLDYGIIMSGTHNNTLDLYLLSGKLENLASDHEASLDLSDAGNLRFAFVDGHKTSHLNTRTVLHKPLGADGKTSMNMNHTISSPFPVPLTINMHSALSNLDLNEWFLGIELNRQDYSNLANTLDDDDEIDSHFFRKPDFATGPIGFIEGNHWFKATSGDQRLDIAYESTGDLLIAQSGYYFSAAMTISPNLNALEVSTEAGVFSGLQKDERHNRFSGPMPYRIHCQGETLSEGDFNKTFYDDFNSPNGICDELHVDIQMQTHLRGHEDTSYMQVRFMPQPPDSLDEIIGLEGRNDWMQAPWLADLSPLDDGKASRYLASENPQLQLRFNQTPATAALSRVYLAYQLYDESDWTELDLHLTGDSYTANLPVVSGSHRVSLRVEAEDERGHSMKQTLNSAFYLGTGTETTTPLAPFFSPIPSFIKEATGPLTPIKDIFVGVYAYEFDVGDVPAEMAGDGLLGLGSHEVVWMAVGSNGLTGYTVQHVEIIDTTPPQINIPASSPLQVAAGGTVDNPATVTAVDLVDGDVEVTPDKTGPFGVGVHTITWSASDLSGNTATAVQTLTVTTATNAANDSNADSGGGGSSGLWSWLLLIMGYYLSRGRGRKYSTD